MDEALQSRVINLTADAPSRDPFHAAYLLGALAAGLPPGCVVVAVVDPGVGSGRLPIMVESAGRTFVGPDNGLLSRIVADDPEATIWRIDWQPERLSRSFHGRDLFAPVAGLLSIGQSVARTEMDRSELFGMDWPAQLAEIVYIDIYGNAMTGVSAAGLGDGKSVLVAGRSVPRASTFADVDRGQLFWYENSFGLVELAVNGGDAANLLGLEIGSKINFD